MKCYLLLIGLLIFGCNAKLKSENDTADLSNEEPLYIQMAKSEIKRNPDPRYLDFRTSPKWEYSNGLVCLAMIKVWERTGKERFLDYARFYADSMINQDGSIQTYSMDDYNIDRINSGKVLFELLEVDQVKKYKKAIDTLRQQMANQPRTSEGGFWHKKRYPYQMWLDGLYMGGPFLARYAKENNKPEIFDEVALQFELIDQHSYHQEKQLYYHGWDESREQKWADPETGLSPEFWGRAMGWFSMAVVDVLDYFPQDHPKRQMLIRVSQKVAEGIKRYQDPESGVWYQVLDKGDKEDNYLEASCSSMFTYFLAKAVDKGYIDQSYQQVADKAYEGIVSEFIKTNPDGTVSLAQICGVAGLGGDPYRDGSYEYYVSELIRPNDPKGVGPFIMASLLMEK